MESTSLTELAAEQIAAACHASSGRAARTIHGGSARVMRQTVLALAAGHGLAEHDNPGEATLQVLDGRVQLATATETWDVSAGDHVTIPAERHSLTASTNAAVLLTVAQPG